MKHFPDLLPREAEGFLKSVGEKPYRARQIRRWIFAKNARTFAEMTDLAPALREKLAASFSITSLRRLSGASSVDGTERLNFATSDGLEFPTVILRAPRGKTLCLSTQIGCPVGCAFCVSGKSFSRNLTHGEIVESCLETASAAGQSPAAVLFMGQGEPLLNYDALAETLADIVSPDGMALGARHVTVSTVGIVGGIDRLASDGFKVRLALSLHTASENLRKKLIPRVSARVGPILDAAFRYAAASKTRLTVECVMIKDVTAAPKRLEELSLALAKRKPRAAVAVNLIPYNNNARFASPEFRCPDGKTLEAARRFLVSRGIFTIIRENKGQDISSACGQLGVG